MTTIIAESLDDFTTLADVLGGTFRPSKSARILGWVVLVLFAVVLPVMVFMAEVKDGWSHWFSLAMLLIGMYTGTEIMAFHASTYSISEQNFARVCPLDFKSRRLDVYSLATVAVVHKNGWGLRLKSQSGKELVLPLEGELRSRFRNLYPDLVPATDNPVLPGWLRKASFSCLAVVVALAALIWWLIASGRL